MQKSKSDIINKLRKDILLLEGFKPSEASNAGEFSFGAIEASFPNGVFPIGAIHEMICPTLEQAAATGGFTAGLLASLMKHGGVCLWISTSRKIFPASLIAFNVEPDRIIFIDL